VLWEQKHFGKVQTLLLLGGGVSGNYNFKTPKKPTWTKPETTQRKNAAGSLQFRERRHSSRLLSKTERSFRTISEGVRYITWPEHIPSIPRKNKTSQLGLVDRGEIAL